MKSPDAREPWSKFYWADWRSDPRLRMCCLAARGLWIEMLSIMHEAIPYGHLLVNGSAPTDAQLAIMVGCGLPELRRLKAELAAAGVPTINEDGIWISRRMVRDAHRRAVNRENAKGGGNPALMDNRTQPNRITESDNRKRSEADISRDARDPDARSQRLESQCSTDLVTVGDRVIELAGGDPTRWSGGYGFVRAWLTAGCLPDEDIYPTVARLAEQPGFKLRSLKYFNDAVLEARDQRRARCNGSAAEGNGETRYAVVMARWRELGWPKPMPQAEDHPGMASDPRYADDPEALRWADAIKRGAPAAGEAA